MDPLSIAPKIPIDASKTLNETLADTQQGGNRTTGISFGMEPAMNTAGSQPPPAVSVSSQGFSVSQNALIYGAGVAAFIVLLLVLKK